MAGAALQAIEGGTLLTLRVAPGASRDALGEFGEWRGALAVRVSAPASSGRANAALIALLAQALDWPGRAILLESGDSNRLKRLRIIGGGDALERLTARIEQWMEMT